MSDRIRVAIVDDHPLFREGVAATLQTEGPIDLVAQGASADDAVRICEEELPDVLLLDISMPGNGLVAARHIARICPYVKIVVLTASENEDHVSAALEAGARGYILKGVSAGELIATITAINGGETYVTPSLAARLLTQMRQRLTTTPEDELPALTPREEEILGFVAEGFTNKEIALRLGISEKTVKHYMTNIMEKLQVRNRVEAALAVRARPGAGKGASKPHMRPRPTGGP